MSGSFKLLSKQLSVAGFCLYAVHDFFAGMETSVLPEYVRLAGLRPLVPQKRLPNSPIKIISKIATANLGLFEKPHSKYH